MNLYVGTSGYAYKEWKGSFYPADLPAKRMLHYYGEHFRSVEINNTFYRMPTAALLQAWAAEVPAGFRFVLKASQRITHQHRLGALLFQLPLNLKKDVARLDAFLALLLLPHRAAFEFRHPSWFDDEIFGLLRTHQAALCIAETEGDLVVPCVATADWGYLRLRRPDYDDAELRVWAQRVRQLDWRDAFVFFKHEEAGRGPQLAQRFLQLAA